MRYRDPEDKELSLAEASWQAVQEILKDSSRGDVLVFLPTEQDIREAIEMGPKSLGREHCTLLPLYARLPSAEQRRIFQSSPSRKIIFSTNIAETSLTIPGIRFVVDSGLARLARYSPGTGTFGLPVEAVSQSSADQRKGRCGRVEEGICIRLYSEEDYLGRSLYTQPEVLRTNLAEVILRMLDLKIQEVQSFPFIDPPSSAGLNDGYRSLIELGAVIKGKGKNPYSITTLGREMARMPMDPRLARMLIQSSKEGCVREILVLAAVLSIQDPRERPQEKAGSALEAQRVFIDNTSDFLTLLNIWKHWEKRKGSLMKRIKSFSKDHYLSFRRMKEWVDLVQQFSQIAKEKKWKIKPFQGNEEALSYSIHRSVISGFLSHVVRLKEGHSYEATRNRQAFIFPGSALFKNGSTWMVSAEIVRTSKLYLRINAIIEPQWLMELGEHLLTRRYLEPRWEEKQAQVLAREEIRIYNFLLENENWVPYGPVKPQEAREIFIQQGLMEGLENNAPDFLIKNRELIKNLRQQENRLRRRDLVDYSREQSFYSERIPPVSSLSELLLHIKSNGQKNLLIKEEDLLIENPQEHILAQYPDSWSDNKHSYQIQYVFNPGDEKDGPTLMVPKDRLNQWEAPENEAIIPGLQEEQITHYLKSLPKAERKQLIPIREHVKEILQSMVLEDGESLEEGLCRFIYRTWNIQLPVSSFQKQNLPAHLQLKYGLQDHRGRVVKHTIHSQELKIKSENPLDEHLLEEFNRHRSKPIASFSGLDLSKVEKHKIKGKWQQLFPSFEIRDHQVWTIYCQDKSKAAHGLRQGAARLLSNNFSKEIKNFSREFSLEKYHGKLVHFKDYSHWIEDLWLTTLGTFCSKPLYKEESFQELAKQIAGELFDRGSENFELLLKIVQSYSLWRDYLQSIKKSALKHQQEFLSAREDEAEEMLQGHFFQNHPIETLEDYPRGFRCLKSRTEKALLLPTQDKEREAQWIEYLQKGREVKETLSPYASDKKKEALKEYFLLVQEYKVALFCQEEKRRLKVSPKRMNNLLLDIQGMV